MGLDNKTRNQETNVGKGLRFDPKKLGFSRSLAISQESRELRLSPDVRIMKILELTGQDPIEIGLKNLIQK